jgi:threonine dehydrogenase-like Zn-dependent dehydrogenase
MGAAQVIAIDHYPRRLELAARFGAKTLNFHDVKVRATLTEMTGGAAPTASSMRWAWRRTATRPTTSWIS